MSEGFSRIESKIDKIMDQVTSIKVTTAKQGVTLEAQHADIAEHIKRTDLLEAQLEPVKKHVAMVNGAFKLLGIIAALGGLVEAMVSVFSNIRH